MKRYLLYIAIISLGTLIFTSPVQATHGSSNAKIVSNTIAKPVPEAQTAPVAASPASVPVTTVAAAPAAPAPSPAPAVPTTPDEIMAAAGIASSDYTYVDYIVSHESGWCATKWEGEYGSCPAFHGVSDYDGYGLCQSTPPEKMASAGADWETNPVTQLKWCTSHALDSYGSWYAAYLHWVAFHNW